MADEPKKTVKTTAYIPIHNPFTVDLDRDQRDPVNSPAGHFRTLTNYIPAHSIIETRRGIVLFVQSASAVPTTATASAPVTAATTNSFIGDPYVKGLWRFENNVLDSIGGNHFTAFGSPTYNTADMSEGEYCIDLELDSSQYAQISDGSLDAGFPGKNGAGHLSWSMAGFFKPETMSGGMGIWMKWVSASANNTFALMLGVDSKMILYMGCNAGADSVSFEVSAALSTGVQYHIGLSYDHTTRGVSIRTRNCDTGVLVQTANTTGALPSDNSPGVSPLEIGRNPNSGGDFYDGTLDEFVFFDKVLSDTEIDSIYGQTYVAPTNDFATETAIVSVWNFEDDVTDELGNNNLTAYNAPTYSTDFMQGAKSINMDGVDQYASIVDTACSSNVPGKNGTSACDFSILGWVKPNTASHSQGVISKWNWGANEMAWLLALESNTYEPKFYIGSNGGAGYTLVKHTSSLTTGEWYFFSCAYRNSDKKMTMRWRNRNGVLLSPNYEGTATAEMSPTPAPLEIGRFNETSATSALCKFDEFILIKKYVSDADIDNMFNKTFT